MKKILITLVTTLCLFCQTFAQFIETSQEMDNSIVFEGKNLNEIFNMLNTNKSQVYTRTILNFLNNNTVSLLSPISNISMKKVVSISPEGEVLSDEKIAEQKKVINEITSARGFKGVMKAVKQTKDLIKENKGYTQDTLTFYFSPSFESSDINIYQAKENNFEEYAKMYNADKYNGKTFAFIGVVKRDSELQLLDKEVVKHGFGKDDKFVLKDKASDFTVQLTKEQMLNAGFEVDAFKEWNKDRIENLQMKAFDFSEPYGFWLLRYWDIPRYHDQLASQEYFDYESGKAINVANIEVSNETPSYKVLNNDRYESKFNVISSEEIKLLNELYGGKYFTKISKENYIDERKSLEYNNIDNDKFKIEKIILTDRQDVKNQTSYSKEYNLAVVTDAGEYLSIDNFYLPELLNLSEKGSIIKYTYPQHSNLIHRYYSYSGHSNCNRYAPYDLLKQERDAFIKSETKRAEERAKRAEERAAESKKYEKEKEAEYQVNLKKYGNKIATAIKNDEICVGMTEEMISKAIGLATKTVLGTKISDGKAYDHVKYKGLLVEYEVLMYNGKVFHIINENGLKKLMESGIFQ